MIWQFDLLILTLVVIPAMYAVVQGFRYRKEFTHGGDGEASGAHVAAVSSASPVAGTEG